MSTSIPPRALDSILPALDKLSRRLGLRITRSDFDLRHVPLRQREIVAKVLPYTATEGATVVGLLDAVDYIERNRVEGAVVECGVYRGGSMMAAALGLLAQPGAQRQLWLYDTFEGMPEPTPNDVRVRDGKVAAELFEARKVDGQTWMQAGLRDVQANMLRTGYPEHLMQFVPGRVEQTIPSEAPESIALLRLDTDWYESTRHELNHLFPLLSPGGVLIVDDYHYWLGSRKAVDEYFANAGIGVPLFARIGSTGAVMARF